MKFDMSTKKGRSARMEQIHKDATAQFSMVFGNRLAELTLKAYVAGMEQVKHEDPDIRNATPEQLRDGYFFHLSNFKWTKLMDAPELVTRDIAQLLVAYHVAGMKHDTEEEA